MGNISIDGIILNSRMAWTNEFAESKIVSNTAYALDGSLIVQYFAKKAGIPMILKGGAAPRATIIALHALQEEMKTCTLTMQDGRVFTVVFDGASSIKASPIGEYHNTSLDLYYELELHLRQIDET